MTTLEALRIPGRVPEWNLADRLRKARLDAGFHQAVLAKGIGVSLRSLGKYESGESVPKLPTMLSWAMHCGVDSDWLIRGTPSAVTDPTRTGEDSEPTVAQPAMARDAWVLAV